MAQNNKVVTLKKLETASMWCAISSLLVFFVNLIAFVAMLVMASGSDASLDALGDKTYYLTLATEFTSLALILAWIAIAIIQMVMIGKNKELGKYHHGSFTMWILAMVISFGFLFISLLIFFVSIDKGWGKGGVYVSFSLYMAATIGSILYISSITRSLRRIKYDLE